MMAQLYLSVGKENHPDNVKSYRPILQLVSSNHLSRQGRQFMLLGKIHAYFRIQFVAGYWAIGSMACLNLNDDDGTAIRRFSE